MIRTQISLSAAQKQRLDQESVRTGSSLAELIRRAVDRVYGGDVGTDAAIDAITGAAGAWSERDEDGAAYVERIRSGRRITR